MLRFSTWKILAVLLLAFGSIAYTVPSLFSKEQLKAWNASIPSFVPKWLVPHKAITLGLDLQGGAHLLLEVDTQSVIRQQAEQIRNDVRNILREERIAVSGGLALQPRGVSFRLPEGADRVKVMTRLRALAQPQANALLGATGPQLLQITEGEGGAIQMAITDAGVQERIGNAIVRSIEVIRKRVDPDGTTEPNIQRQGADRVLLQVPGATDAEEVKRRVGSTAELEFRFVAEQGTPEAETETVAYSEGGGTLRVERAVIVKGDDLIDAQAGPDSQRGGWAINFRFNIKGARAFGDATSRGVGRRLAILLIDKKPGGIVEKNVVSAPTVNTPITGGAGQITGTFSAEAANSLAIQLRSGALPVALTVVEERTVGPGLGADSIASGKMAAYVAAGLVCVFMLITYGLFGVFANIALIIHILLIFALSALIGATMTLPGIAGIVLTIGTAVDANVLIYERIREEFKAGRSMVSSLEAGFNRAFATIIDSNVTMFIAALILYILGSGPVRGFAVTMILGIITSVVTAVTMTRMMIALWYKLARPKTLPF